MSQALKVMIFASNWLFVNLVAIIVIFVQCRFFKTFLCKYYIVKKIKDASIIHLKM